MKRCLNLPNIGLLCCLILLGSILEVHSSVGNIGSEVSESVKEVEDFSNSIVPYIATFASFTFTIKLSTSVFLFEHDSQFQSTVPQLLCSNRIALPPPLLN